MNEHTIPIGCGTVHRYEIIERCGHFPWFEAPDRFQSLLAEFLG